MNSCEDCKHLSYHAADGVYSDMSYYFTDWNECDVRTNLTNLKQFPFRRTKCDKFEPK